jgi:hypothetical protein
MSIRRAWIRLLSCLLGSYVLIWLLPRMVLAVASALLCLTWMLSLPTWGLMWMGQSNTYMVLWTMVDRHGYRAPDRCRRVLSCCSGWRGVRTPFRGGAKPPGKIRDVVLTARVPVGSNPLWRSPALPEHAYLMLELSCQLCVFLWWNGYVRQ